MRAAIGIQPPELSAAVAIQTLAAHLKLETLKKPIMQVTVCKSVTLAVKTSKLSGRIAIGFPLPSTGRGIEGEGWSYPEPPPVRFFLYQPHPGSRLNTEHFPPNP